MTTRTRTPAAAPAWVRDLVAGAERPAAVVHVGADAVYLDVDGRCLGIMSATGTAVPCGLRTALPAVDVLVPLSREALVGDGRVALGDHDVVPARVVDASVPGLTGRQVSRAAGLLPALVADRTEEVARELAGEALDGLVRADPAAVTELLGRGSGLTPLGDDVLAGWLATAVAAGALRTAPATAVAAEVAARAPAGTTLLSATLLDCAARGEVLPQYRRLLLDLADPREPSPAAALDALVAVGHTSGAGLALGTSLALRHLASRSPRP
ncbi:MAG TPA: DUF2877 domain-containing protein [Nocardioidaceae bacterium]|jgi:hypothetical protein